MKYVWHVLITAWWIWLAMFGVGALIGWIVAPGGISVPEEQLRRVIAVLAGVGMGIFHVATLVDKDEL